MTPDLHHPIPEADRVRNRAHGEIRRSRAIQLDAIRHGNHERAEVAGRHIDRMLDDLLSLRPRKLNATYTAPAT